MLARRGANITACDYHPLAGEFLRQNAELNGLATIPFHIARWEGPNPELGQFDLIIGSDLLYERDHATLLAGFIERHAKPAAQVLIADPGRGYVKPFSVLMAAQGYVRTEQRMPMSWSIGLPPSRGQMFSFLRAPVAVP